jgi:N-acetylneuraminic acid mutarotase
MRCKSKMSKGVHVAFFWLAVMAIGNQAFAQSGLWTTKAPMPAPRTDFAVGVINGILYVVGGHTSDTSGATFFYTTLEAYDPTTNTWTPKADMPTARGGLGASVVNGILYVVGGAGSCAPPCFITSLATVEAYDPATNTWTTKADMPTPRIGVAVEVVNGILYAIGGFSSCCGPNGPFGALATVEAYDPATNTWTTKTPMPTARGALAASIVNGVIYAIGGGNGSTVFATVEAYDPTTNTWNTKTSMPTPRAIHNGTGVVNGIIYAFGGIDICCPGIGLNTAEAYDPMTNTWTTKTPMPTARFDQPTAVVNNVLYVVGGTESCCPEVNTATVEAYDPKLDPWTTKTPMPTARGGLATAVVNGILYAMGGNVDSCCPENVTATVEAYNPTTDTWTTKAPMPTARWGIYNGTGVVNGIIYAIGGTGSTPVPLNKNEAYDPTTNTWTPKADMPTARDELAIGVVNGILYAVGGRVSLDPLVLTTTVEAYDPTTDTWTTKASMPTARAGLGVEVVNGILYAVGGYTGGPFAVTTVEAYDPATDTWTTKAPMPTARAGLGVSAVNGILYAVGGAVSFNPHVLTSTVEAYDPTTNTWTTMAPMPTARVGLGVEVVNGVLYAIGGFAPSFPGLGSATVEAFFENTPEGSNVVVQPVDLTTGTTPITLTFSSVSQTGTTGLITSSTGPSPPTGFELLGTYYDISTTAIFTPPVDVCIQYSPPGDGSERIFHYENNSWVDVTIPDSNDTVNGLICGQVNTLSLFFVSRPAVKTVSIDIKPGSDPNSINLGSGGTVPVAIFSTADFDATTVDPLTVMLASAPVQLKGKGTPMASSQDVNEDGLLDLVVHVDTTALQLSETDTQATLQGQTFGGTSIQGSDSVRIVP